MKEEKRETYETRSTLIEVLDKENGIIKILRKQGVELIPEDLVEIDQKYEEILNGRKGKFIVVYQLDGQVASHEFNEKASAGSRSRKKAGEAIIVETLANRIEANFFINNYNFYHPIKIFSNENEGIEWLKSID